MLLCAHQKFEETRSHYGGDDVGQSNRQKFIIYYVIDRGYYNAIVSRHDFNSFDVVTVTD